jgi:hypothetical protein
MSSSTGTTLDLRNLANPCRVTSVTEGAFAGCDIFELYSDVANAALRLSGLTGLVGTEIGPRPKRPCCQIPLAETAGWSS